MFRIKEIKGFYFLFVQTSGAKWWRAVSKHAKDISDSWTGTEHMVNYCQMNSAQEAEELHAKLVSNMNVVSEADLKKAIKELK